MRALAMSPLLGLLLSAACGSSKDRKPAPTSTAAPAPPPPSGATVDRFCHQTDKGRCQSSRLAVGYEAERAELDCQQAGGSWTQTPCATAVLVGRCVAATKRSTTFFSPPHWTEESARATCAAPATWKPGTN